MREKVLGEGKSRDLKRQSEWRRIVVAQRSRRNSSSGDGAPIASHIHFFTQPGNRPQAGNLDHTHFGRHGKQSLGSRRPFQAVDARRRPTPQAAVPAKMIIIREVPRQPQPGLGRRLVIPKVHVLVLHRPPQPLDHDVIERPGVWRPS
jgi:hypothetical protein